MGTKRLISICITITLLLCGCTPKLTEGNVYQKEYREADSTLIMMPVVISNGKTTTTIMRPYYIFHPDRYVIFIRRYNEETKTFETEDYYVSREAYESVDIGDYFVFSDDLGTDEERIQKKEQMSE